VALAPRGQPAVARVSVPSPPCHLDRTGAKGAWISAPRRHPLADAA